MAKVIKSAVSPLFSMPKCTMEVLPENEVISNIITAMEADAMVDNLKDNGFGQLIAHSRQAVVKAGKDVKSYEDAAKVVGGVIEHFKTGVMLELDERRKGIETGTLLGEDKVEALNRLTSTRARLDNSFKSAKSVITGALKKGDTILKIALDGGHILFRKDGVARGKTELQNLIKRAKAHDAPDKTALEKAMDAGATLARRLVDLNAQDRKLVLDTMRTKLAELDEEKDETEEVEDTEPTAKAA